MFNQWTQRDYGGEHRHILGCFVCSVVLAAKEKDDQYSSAQSPTHPVNV